MRIFKVPDLSGLYTLEEAIELQQNNHCSSIKKKNDVVYLPQDKRLVKMVKEIGKLATEMDFAMQVKCSFSKDTAPLTYNTTVSVLGEHKRWVSAYCRTSLISDIAKHNHIEFYWSFHQTSHLAKRMKAVGMPSWRSEFRTSSDHTGAIESAIHDFRNAHMIYDLIYKED